MCMTRLWRAVLSVILCAWAVAAAGYRGSSPPPQDPSYLDRRISSLEQRLYAMESSLRRLEQSATLQRPSPSAGDANLLRGEIEVLKVRMRELECALARLDERTLSAPVREARRRAGPRADDACRLNPEAPIQLPPYR